MYFIENKVWLTGYDIERELIKSDFPVSIDIDLLDNGNINKLYFEPKALSVHNYASEEAVTCLEFWLDKNNNEWLYKIFIDGSENSKLKIDKFCFKILKGAISIITIIEVKQDSFIETENDIIDLSKKINIFINNKFQKIFHLMNSIYKVEIRKNGHPINILFKEEGHIFGVPFFILGLKEDCSNKELLEILELRAQDGRYSQEYSYMSNSHLLFINQNTYFNIIKNNITNNFLDMNYNNINFSGAISESICLWNLHSANSEEIRIIVNYVTELSNYTLFEKLIYNTGLGCYTEILENIENTELIITSKALRKIIISNKKNLLKIQTQFEDLVIQQKRFVNQIKLDGNYEFLRNMFNSAQEDIIYAVEGLEKEESSNANKMIQSLLIVLTFFSTYGIVSEAYSFLISDFEKEISLYALIFYVFLSSFFVYVYKRSKKIFNKI